jgi:hypothetical protein
VEKCVIIACLPKGVLKGRHACAVSNCVWDARPIKIGAKRNTAFTECFYERIAMLNK